MPPQNPAQPPLDKPPQLIPFILVYMPRNIGASANKEDFYRKLRSKKFSVQVRARVSKSPLPPFSKGGQGGFLPSGLEPYVPSLKAHCHYGSLCLEFEA